MNVNPGRTRLLASGLLGVTFMVGALVGAAGDRLLTAEQESAATVQPAAPREPRNERERNRSPRGSILLDPNVLEQLGTTAEQREKIHAVLARRDQEAKRIYQAMKPELDAMMKETREELRAQLTAEQRTRLDQIIEERRAQWRANRARESSSKTPTDSAKRHPESPRDHEPRI